MKNSYEIPTPDRRPRRDREKRISRARGGGEKQWREINNKPRSRKRWSISGFETGASGIYIEYRACRGTISRKRVARSLSRENLGVVAPPGTATPAPARDRMNAYARL